MGAFLIAIGLIGQANLAYEHCEEQGVKLWESWAPKHEYIVDQVGN